VGIRTKNAIHGNNESSVSLKAEHFLLTLISPGCALQGVKVDVRTDWHIFGRL
jgi:hypothetical protein